MADIIDDANETAELFLREALTAKKESGPEPVGACLYCAEIFAADSTRRFCDAECRDGWEKEQGLRY